MLSLERLKFVLNAFPDLTVGLVGDLFLDRYLEIPAGREELSIETGLEAYQVTRVRNSPGALGTVMNNLAALGAGTLMPVTVIGDDGRGYDLLQQLDRLPVDPAHIVRSPQRLTPTYTKPMQEQPDGNWLELNRLDIRTRKTMSDSLRAEVCRRTESVFSCCDGIIVLDQISETDQGVVDTQVRLHLADLQRRWPDRVVFVDSRTQLAEFDFGILKGNQSEVLAVAGSATDPKNAVQVLCQRTSRPAFCTCGADGVLVGMPDGTVAHVPAYPVEGPIDIVGAGDSITSGIVLALLAGASAAEAAAIGNLVASITVQQLGTTGTARPEQVIERWHDVYGAS